MLYLRYRYFSFISLFLLVVNAQQQQQQDTDATFYPAKISMPQYTDDPTQSYRQNICDRQWLYANGEIRLRDALEGLQLHPILTSGIPEAFVPITRDVEEVNEWGVVETKTYQGYDPNNPGLLVEILDELSIRANFTWKESYGITGAPTNNTNYDDLSLWMAQTYDIAVGPFGHLASRYEIGLNFPAGFTDNTAIMIALEDDGGKAFDLTSVFQPFDVWVWVTIIGTILFSAIVSWILEYERRPKEQRTWRPQTRDVFYASMAFTGNYAGSDITTNPNMVFQFSLAFWATLVISAYTANLASFFVVQNTPSLNIQSIQDAMENLVPVCVATATSIDVAITEVYPTAKNVVRKDSFQEVFDGLNKGECTIAAVPTDTWNIFRGNIQVNGACQMYQVGRPYTYLQGGFATKADHGTLCTSLIRDVLNIHMVDMINEGLVDKLKEENLYYQEIDCNAVNAGEEEAEDEDTYQLTLNEMAGTFVLHGLLCSVALILAGLGYFQKKIKKANDNNQQRRKKTDHEMVHEEKDLERTSSEDKMISRDQIAAQQQAKLIQQLLEIQIEMKDEMKIMSNQLAELTTTGGRSHRPTTNNGSIRRSRIGASSPSDDSNSGGGILKPPKY